MISALLHPVPLSEGESLMSMFASRRGFFSTVAASCLAAVGLRPRPTDAAPPPPAPPPPAPATEPTTICFSAAGLPDGISLDPSTGLITGVIDSSQGDIRLTAG